MSSLRGGIDSVRLKKRSSATLTPSARQTSADFTSRDQRPGDDDDHDDATSASSGDTSMLSPPLALTSTASIAAREPLQRIQMPDDSDSEHFELDVRAFHRDAAWRASSKSAPADDDSNTSSLMRAFGCVRRCLSANSQPGLFDEHDPALRKHSGGPQHRLPYKYRPLRLLDVPSGNRSSSSRSSGRNGYAAVLGLDTIDDSADNDDDAHVHVALAWSSLSALRLIDKEHMAVLTTSVLQSTWIFLLLLGVLASSVAWSVDWCVLHVQQLRNDFVALGDSVWIIDYGLYTTYRVFILVLGVACTVFVCPNAAGSGIPEMRSILGGFPCPDYLTKRTLVAKACGLIFALGSGLSIGKEGPFVHLSCVIAHQLLRVPLFAQIRQSPDLTHHVLAAACAVGVTATFGTPIGGVLFSIEVTTTYYITSNYWRAFFSSVVAVCVFRLLNSLMTGNTAALFTTDFAVLPYASYEVALFLVLATICGVLGAVFVKLYRVIVALKARFVDLPLATHWPAMQPAAPFLYAATVALVFALVEFPVGHFMQLSQRQLIDDMFSTGNLTSADTTHLESDFGQLWTSPSLALNLFAYVCVRFVSTAISATVMVPSGIVTPVFAVGAAIGRLFGEVIVFVGGGSEISNALAGGYAVVGAASLTAGVTGTISIAVIVFELTSQLSYMIPVLLSVLVGRAVAAIFSLDMYDTISREKHLPQWPDLTKQRSYTLTASALMRPVPPHWLARHQTLATLQQLLHETPVDVTLFPVVDDAQTMLFLGAVEREELESVAELWAMGLESSTSDNKSNNKRREETATAAAAGGSLDAFAGLSPAQAAALCDPATRSDATVDVVRLELFDLDARKCDVHRDAFASHVILLISVHKAPELFVTARGKLLGVIHAADLLARSRRFML